MKKTISKVGLAAMVVAIVSCIASSTEAMTIDQTYFDSNYILLNPPNQPLISSVSSVSSSQVALNQNYFSSGNNVFCGSVNLWGRDDSGALRVSVNVSQDCDYLVACYGSFTQVYDLSGYDKTKTFLVLFTDNLHKLTSWTACGPTTTQTSVPDGGVTVILLGTALAGLGFFRRRVRA